jgi:hypothetical protein
MSREGGHSGVVIIVEAIAKEKDKGWACKVEFGRWGFVYEWRLTLNGGKKNKVEFQS